MIACSRLTAGTFRTTPQSALRPRTTRSALSSIIEPSLAPFMILRRGMAGFPSLVHGSGPISYFYGTPPISRYFFFLAHLSQAKPPTLFNHQPPPPAPHPLLAPPRSR